METKTTMWPAQIPNGTTLPVCAHDSVAAGAAIATGHLRPTRPSFAGTTAWRAPTG